jgi:hypothetical protein
MGSMVSQCDYGARPVRALSMCLYAWHGPPRMQWYGVCLDGGFPEGKVPIERTKLCDAHIAAGGGGYRDTMAWVLCA